MNVGRKPFRFLEEAIGKSDDYNLVDKVFMAGKSLHGDLEIQKRFEAVYRVWDRDLPALDGIIVCGIESSSKYVQCFDEGTALHEWY